MGGGGHGVLTLSKVRSRRGKRTVNVCVSVFEYASNLSPVRGRRQTLVVLA